MRRLRWVIPLALLVALALLAVAPFTATGTRLAVAAANTVPGLSVQHRSGTLLGDLELAALRFAAAGVDIDLAEVSARLDSDCLWQSRLCFDRLAIRSLRVAVLAAGDDAPDANAEDAFFRLPFGIRAPQLEIGGTEVTWPGGSLRSGELSAGVAFRDDVIRVRRLAVPELILDLGEFDGPAATARLALPRLFLPLDLELVQGRLMRGEVRAAGQIVHLDGLALSAGWRGQRLRLTELSSTLPDWGEVALSGELQFADEWPVSARLDLQLANSETLPAMLRGRRSTLTGDGSLGALSWSLALAGDASLAAEGELDLLQPGLPFSLGAELAWSDPAALARLVPLPESLAGLQPGSPLTLTASGDTAFQAFELRGAAAGMNYQDLELLARGAHRDGRVVLDRLELLEAGTDSQLVVAGEFGYAAVMTWELLLESSGLTLPSVSPYVSGRLQGSARVSGDYDGDDWHASVDGVDITGTINELPAAVTGGLALTRQELVTRASFEADLNGAAVSLGKEAGQDGRLELDIEDLGRWLPGAEGSLALAATLGRDGGDIAFSGSVTRLQWQELRVAGLDLSGRGRLDDSLPFELLATANGLTAGRLAGERAQLSLRGDGRAVSAALTVSGDIDGSLQLDARSQQQLWLGSLTTDGIATPAGTWQASAPVDLVFDAPDGTLAVSSHCWTTDDGSVCFEDARIGSDGSAGAELDLELALLEFMLPPQLSVAGRVVGRASVGWETGSTVAMSAALDVADARLEQQLPEGEIAAFSIDSARLLVDTGESGTRLQAAAEREGKQIAAADLRLAPAPERGIAGVMSFDDFRLAALRPFVPQLSRLSGKLDGTIELSGSPDRPALRGSAEVTEGYLSLIGNPNALDELTLAITLSGEAASLSGTARLGDGPASLAGSARWGDQRRLQLRLEGQRNRLLVPPYSELLVSSGFDILVTPELADVAGEVTVHEGRLEHEQLPAGSVAVSEDVVEVDYAGNVLQERAPFAIRSRVRVVIEDRFRVVGTNIDATVGGDLRLEQDPDRPMQVFGTLNVIGGEVRAYGSRLTVAQGTINFSGDPDNPQLNLRAERDFPRDRVLVGVIMTGTLQEPLLEIFSEPNMPQTAALSWLVRGRGPDSGPGADGTAMAISMGASVINQTGVVSEINRIPGISNVEFGAEGVEDDTAATVSGYIGERIYLSYGVGIYEPINVLTARLYLQARLWLEVVSRLENSLDLYYSFDID